MYKIIDEKLRLASCSISDLTMKQVKDFLSGWEEGASIRTLTLFYDEEKNLVVLNQDNKNYERIHDMVLGYMELNEEKRDEALQKVPKSLKETFRVLNQSIEKIKYKEEYKRIIQHAIPCRYNDYMKYIWNESGSEFMAFLNAFHYGMMCGKREERARRKSGVAV